MKFFCLSEIIFIVLQKNYCIWIIKSIMMISTYWPR